MIIISLLLIGSSVCVFLFGIYTTKIDTTNPFASRAPDRRAQAITVVSVALAGLGSVLLIQDLLYLGVATVENLIASL